MYQLEKVPCQHQRGTLVMKRRLGASQVISVIALINMCGVRLQRGPGVRLQRGPGVRLQRGTWSEAPEGDLE